ncbi:O-methyltransferase [Litorihabitans aurantiacus]|uniref:O-methyltransferase n=1 Tax=Litorihabitans aurantiacus TaxID=1930061 RepID=A0AA37XG15_9MICO|nr:O-methyltransferase [Litorihabitans aurantiacus]GMA32150.1 putative O-methyltransferase [Litorihabitans aurantiacus]
MAGAERADRAQSWAYTEDVVVEPEAAAAARERAAEFGIDAVSPATGALLQVLAAASGARHVVEIGTGTGVSGVWLLGGMARDGVLTTIDVEVEYQREARRAFTAAGVPSSRTRTIAGRALDVLPRLADGAYDLVLLDSDVADLVDLVAQARRLLRVGGTLAVTRALWHDRVADPARRDVDTVAVRELVRQLVSDDGLAVSLVPAGGGLLVAVRR